MLIKCQYCERIYDNPLQPCPFCGAVNEAPPKPSPQAQPMQMRPQGQLTKVQKTSFLIGIVMLALCFVLAAMRNLPSSKKGGPISDSNMGTNSEMIATYDVVEMYKMLEEDPANFKIVLQLTQMLYRNGKTGEARAVAMHLPREQCSDAAIYREMAQIMQMDSDASYACRMYLCAYQLSADAADLASATKIGMPSEIMPNGPTAQALELYLRKPMSLVTWEEIGEIRFWGLRYDYIELSGASPAEMEYGFEDTVQSFPFDTVMDGAYVYLYGLSALNIYTSVQFSEVNLFALQSLRELSLANLSREPNLGGIVNIPFLESLHVGGSGIVSLDGLDRLPHLHTLSLEGTGIETLSALASYRNIKTLSLKNNKALTGLSSLEMMDHLEGLHIERQDVLDFRFLEKMHVLKELSLVNTAVKDIYFLSQLGTLESLTILRNSDLKTVAGIGALTGLRRLSITANEFKMDGVGEIRNLTALEWLRLDTPTSVSMISGLTALRTLELSSLAMLDSLSPVTGLVNLETFRVDSSLGGHGSFENSFAPLASLPKLTHVSITGWDLYESKALFGMKALEYLDLTGCRLAFGAGLGGLTNVKTLKLGGTRWIRNVQIWSDGFMQSVDWDDVSADEVAATLRGLTTVEYLTLNKIALADVSFLSSMTNLEHVNLADNYITDIAPLSEAEVLRQVNLSGNPVRDWSIAEGWTHVYVVR